MSTDNPPAFLQRDTLGMSTDNPNSFPHLLLFPSLKPKILGLKTAYNISTQTGWQGKNKTGIPKKSLKAINLHKVSMPSF